MIHAGRGSEREMGTVGGGDEGWRTWSRVCGANGEISHTRCHDGSLLGINRKMWLLSQAGSQLQTV